MFQVVSYKPTWFLGDLPQKNSEDSPRKTHHVTAAQRWPAWGGLLGRCGDEIVMDMKCDFVSHLQMIVPAINLHLYRMDFPVRYVKYSNQMVTISNYYVCVVVLW